MILGISDFFTFYLLVFLVAISLAWVLFLLQRRRSLAQARRLFVCGTCGARLEVEPPRIRIRCHRCGARHDLSKLKEITNHGNVDRS